MPLPKTFKLNNGKQIPSIGLGTWRAEKGVVATAVQTALLSGYQQIDCAFIYDNEAEIGTVLKTLKERENIFVTSKLWNNRQNDVESALDKTLKDLQLEYLDLYLIHWPITQDPATKKNKIDIDQLKVTWKSMEDMVTKGKAKSIGVSNFTVNHLKELLKDCKIKPQVNQVEMHPYLQQNELLNFCKENDIAITAYSPLGSLPVQGEASVLDDPVVKEVATRNGKTAAQVLISWAIQRGTIVIPKSSNPARIQANSQVFEMSEDDFSKLNALDKNKRYVDCLSWAKVDVFGTSKL